MNAERFLCGFVCLAAVLWAASSSAAEPPRGTLYWRNGDQLTGELLGGTATHLRWRSPRFAEPFWIDTGHLQSLQLEPPEQVQRGGKFQVTTRAGDTLYGDLQQIADDRVVLQTTRGGQVAIPLSAVRTFRHLDNPALIYTGPQGLQGWRTLHPTTRISEWRANPDGTITTGHVGAELFQDLRLPELAEIDITLTWERKPGFVIAFAPPKAIVLSKYIAKLETWEDEVVLQTLSTDGDFDQLLTLDDRTRRLRLRLLWDQQTGELSAYAEDGRLLGKRSAGEASGKGKTAIYIQNKGTDLTLANIQVNHWSGSPTVRADPQQSNLLLTDGSAILGRIEEFDARQGRFVVQEAQGGRRQVPLSQVAGGSFGPQSNDGDPPQTGVLISYFDGTRLHGTIHSIEQDALSLSAAYSPQPMTLRVDALRELQFLDDKNAQVDLSGQRLVMEGIELRGELAAPDAPASGVGWRPKGSRNASPLDLSTPATIVMGEESPDPPESRGALRDVLYLQDGDVIPCDVQSISESHVYAASVFGESTPVPRESVRAIEFAAAGTPAERGFGGRGWETIRGNDESAVELSNDQAVFRDNASARHPGLPLGREVSFSLAWNKTFPVTLTIGFGKQAANPASSVMFYLSNHQIYIRGMQAGLRGQLHLLGEGQQPSDGRSDIRLVFADDRLQVQMDDRQVFTQPLQNAADLRTGLRFDVQRMARANPIPPPAEPLLTISQLRVSQTGNTLDSLVRGDRRLETMLTVPRMRKQSPPAQILVARNGDLLRGRLLELTGDRVHFTSRMADVEVPRARVAGIVWVREPAAATEPPRVEGNLLAVFHSGVTFLFAAERIQGECITGTHSVFGKCEVPVADLSELRIGPSQLAQDRPSFTDWQLRPAKEPRFASGGRGGGPSDIAGRRFGLDSALVGNAAERVEGELFGGGRFRLADHPGKIVILDFWASWCGPCVKSLPEIVAAVGELPADRVMLVSVNLQESAEVVRDFLQNRGLDLAVILDRENALARRFRVEAIPQTVVVGPDGTIERVYVGANAELPDELQAAVRLLLQEPRDPELPEAE